MSVAFFTVEIAVNFVPASTGMHCADSIFVLKNIRQKIISIFIGILFNLKGLNWLLIFGSLCVYM
ncbi:MAG: hypothetical protein D4R41_06525 [Sediminibacterium sp.]|nr:MAG: hypothetical protein D4R41_06525 [Sediminibacterium sp.]